MLQLSIIYTNVQQLFLVTLRHLMKILLSVLYVHVVCQRLICVIDHNRAVVQHQRRIASLCNNRHMMQRWSTQHIR